MKSIFCSFFLLFFFVLLLLLLMLLLCVSAYCPDETWFCTYSYTTSNTSKINGMRGGGGFELEWESGRGEWIEYEIKREANAKMVAARRLICNNSIHSHNILPCIIYIHIAIRVYQSKSIEKSSILIPWANIAWNCVYRHTPNKTAYAMIYEALIH